MKVCIFYYDGFCEFEVVLCAIQFKGSCFTAALEDRVYISEEKQSFLPDKTIDELNPDEIDLFIIPGGNPRYLFSNSKLKNFTEALNKKNRFIAGICAGTYLMAQYGLLKGKRCTGDSSGLKAGEAYTDLFKDAVVTNADIVVDGNTITSTGQAFVEFAFKLSKVMKLYENDEEAQSAYNWFKNNKQ
ncbi:MAG TPA: DJ-1/PfpI family protein [Patescibacteria group bacterium]|nr:DJ-1/PfpI family protein [Patescibacteria group bacterium]